MSRFKVLPAEELWPGHFVTVIAVARWWWFYRLFNKVFARATRKHEYMIYLDIGGEYL